MTLLLPRPGRVRLPDGDLVVTTAGRRKEQPWRVRLEGSGAEAEVSTAVWQTLTRGGVEEEG